MQISRRLALMMALCVVIGSLNLLFKKLQNQTTVPTRSGASEAFNKPWMQTAFVFIGQCLSLAILRVERFKFRSDQRPKVGVNGDANEAQDSTNSNTDAHASADFEAESSDAVGRTVMEEITRTLSPRSKTLNLKAQQVHLLATDHQDDHSDAHTPTTHAETQPLPETHTHIDSARAPAVNLNPNVNLELVLVPMQPSASAYTPALSSTTATTAATAAAHINKQCEHREPDSRSRFDTTRRTPRAFAFVASQWLRHKWLLIFVVPSVIDAAAIALTSTALVYMSASVCAAIRGALLVFTGLLGKLLLKKQMLVYQMVAIGITVLGLLIMGLGYVSGVDDLSVSATSSQASTAGQMAIAFMLALLGMFATAVQQRDFHPALVNGMEGVFGALLMWCVVLPILAVVPGSDHGSFESFADAQYNLAHSARLCVFLALQVACVPVYNVLALQITKELSAVHRAVMDTLRIGLVLLLETFLYYTVDTQYGQQLTDDSAIQALGLAILCVGVLAHNRVFKIPFVRYPESTAPTTVSAPHLTAREFESGTEASAAGTTDDTQLDN